MALSGVTESVVTTLGPNDRWNVAALGIHAPAAAGECPTARTWGRTRTWRNFTDRGTGYVQFVTEPMLFVEAALGILERDEPVLPESHAWVRVDVEAVDSGQEHGTRWEDWRLLARESAVTETSVPTVDRAFNAIVEATVAASRLDVEGYDTDALQARIDYSERVVNRCGDEAERRAFERLTELVADE